MSRICPYSEAIRERRLALRLTQEQVCEGICSIGTYSRIESGRITPSFSRSQALMERLDLSEDQHFAILGRRELDIAKLREEIVQEGCRVFREKGAPRREARERASAKLDELEALREEDDHITAQFIAAQRLLLTEPEGDPAWRARSEALSEVLRMTQPRFRPEDLRELRLSVFELELAAHISFALASGGALDAAMDLADQVGRYCAAHFKGRQHLLGSLYIQPFAVLTVLLRQERWAEALSLAESYRSSVTPFPEAAVLTEIMAWCRLELGEEDAAWDLFRQAYDLNLALMSEGRAQAVAEEAEARLGRPLFPAEEGRTA